ncbi:carbohydrate porin [Neoasaia chiangmaiensis]|nr:carbohydrate porin [Neoasaia chiangmaiensis]
MTHHPADWRERMICVMLGRRVNAKIATIRTPVICVLFVLATLIFAQLAFAGPAPATAQHQADYCPIPSNQVIQNGRTLQPCPRPPQERGRSWYIQPLSNFYFMQNFSQIGNLPSNDIAWRYAFATARSEHLLSDDALWRPWLADHGIRWSLSYKAEVLGNPSGGNRQGMDYASEEALQINIDWNKLAGIPDFWTHMLVVNRAGRNLMADNFGDSRLSLQEVYGAGGNVLAHLVWLYGESLLFNKKLGIDYGRLPVALEVAHSPIYCQFTTICSSPNALKREQAFTVWPKSNWGIAGRIRPVKDNILTFGAFASDAKYGGPSGWNWADNGNTGVLLPIEDMWQPYVGPHALVGHYKVGYAIDTTRYAPLGSFASNPQARGKVRDTVWFLADQMIYRTGQNDLSGVVLFGGYVHNTGSRSVYRSQAFGGIDAGGIVPGRPFDRPGLVFAHYDFSQNLQQEAQTLQALHLPTGNLPLMGENVFELKYGAAIVRGVRFQPEYQYIVHPAASKRLGNASVFGFMTTMIL